MLPLEHSAIFLTCIKRLSVLKTYFGLFDSGRFRQVLLYLKSRPPNLGGQSNITQPKPNVVGTQKNRLTETVLLNTNNRWLSEGI